jgi:peroxiredoxin
MNASFAFVRAALRVLLAAALLPLLSGAASVGKAAPELGMKSLDGAVVELKQFRGQVVYLDFWATWCAPCQQSLPVLEKLNRELASRGFQVIGVNQDGDARKAAELARRLQLSFPSVWDPKGQIASRYSPPTMPSSFLIDREGRVRRVFKGFKPGDAEIIKREVTAVLDEGGTQ